MALRAKNPEAMQKRLKMFMFGGPGVGKTTAAITFPKSYVIDCERGCDHYKSKLEASGSVIFQTNDVDEVIEEVRSLKREAHEYRTVVIDPITTLEADLIEKAEKEFGVGDQRIWGYRDKKLRRLYNLLMGLDMNAIVTAHSKAEYAGGDGKERFVKIGTTHDGWRRLPYAFDLSLELEKRGKSKRVGIVRKTRIDGFPDSEEFDFSYEEVARRYGPDVIGRAAVPVAVASAEQTATLKGLIANVKLEDGIVEKWLTKAGVEALEDLSAEVTEKCIAYIRNKISNGAEKGAAA